MYQQNVHTYILNRSSYANQYKIILECVDSSDTARPSKTGIAKLNKYCLSKASLRII